MRYCLFLFLSTVFLFLCSPHAYSDRVPPLVQKQHLAPSSTDLHEYLRLVHKVDRYAVVTGAFWDWRSLSMYRSVAGYHFGYDIAMPRGTPVPAGWAGRVVAISPWADGEWGVSIVNADGYMITYGHICPKMSVGIEARPGDIVGTVAVNHVDIKIRDRVGSFVDFGRTAGLLPVSADAVIRDISRYMTVSAVSSGMSKKALLDEIKRLKPTIAVLDEYLKMEVDAYHEGESKVATMEKLVEEELVARNSIDEEKVEQEKRKKHIDGLKKRLSDQKSRLALLQKEAKLAGDSGRNGDSGKSGSASSRKVSEVSQQRVDEAKKKWDLYEKLFTEGAISKKELGDARKEYKKLQLEMMLERD